MLRRKAIVMSRSYDLPNMADVIWPQCRNLSCVNLPVLPQSSKPSSYYNLIATYLCNDPPAPFLLDPNLSLYQLACTDYGGRLILIFFVKTSKSKKSYICLTKLVGRTNNRGLPKTIHRSLPFQPIMAEWEEEFSTLQLKATIRQWWRSERRNLPFSNWKLLVGVKSKMVRRIADWIQ